MATSLEAFGAASAVLQVIYFYCSVASLSCYSYDWKPTVENVAALTQLTIGMSTSRPRSHAEIATYHRVYV
ncbi:hypothetical protein AUP68_00656 [Ilyonectria robusta]